MQSHRLPNPDQPNKPEVSGTTFPLLATVLAGFAVTIVIQLFTRDEAKVNGHSPNWLFITGLTVLALSVPLFLHTAAFAMWSQTYNYAQLNEDSRIILNIQENWDTYIARLEKKWALWYNAAFWTFNASMFLFDAGSGILLWNFMGWPIAILFWIASVAPLIMTFILLPRKERSITTSTVSSPSPSRSPQNQP